MPIESASDRAVFVNADEFGATAVYTPAGGAASDPIPGIFDEPSISIEMSEVATLDARPTFFCAEELLPVDAETGAGDQLAVTVDGVVKGPFEVVSVSPDGQGFVSLRLGALT
jgi:hypothetical protein